MSRTAPLRAASDAGLLGGRWRRLSLRGRWQRLSLRARLTVVMSATVAVGLAIGSFVVNGAFVAARFHDVDRQTGAELATVAALVHAGALPATLPAPNGSPVLAQVLAADGAVLAATPSASRVQALPLPGTRPVVTDESGAFADQPLRVHARRVDYAGTPVTVVAAAPLGDVRRGLRAFHVVLFLAGPVLVGGAAVVVWVVAGLALRPVERLRAEAEAFARDPLAAPPVPVAVAGPRDELGRLAGTLEGLLRSLRDLVGRERGFVADAAHELRSPVASLRVQLDVARAHPGAYDVPTMLADLSADVERLQRLVDGLLALARAEAAQGPPTTVIDLRAVARDAGAVEVGGEGLLVRGDAEALRRAVSNLLANAGRHGRVVEVSARGDGGDAVLLVDDDGPGIPFDDRERVFERWVRLDDARARDTGGAGLGLAVVREVARSHGGSVRILTSPLGGARLELRLPRVSGGTDGTAASTAAASHANARSDDAASGAVSRANARSDGGGAEQGRRPRRA